MGAAEQIARQRLSVLQLAEALGGVSEACRQRGMKRTILYGYNPAGRIPRHDVTHHVV